MAVTGDPQEPDCFCVVLEGSVVIDDISDFPTAICLFFALHYVLNLEYNNGKSSRTFEYIQKLLMKIGDNKLTPKLLSLNKKMIN